MSIPEGATHKMNGSFYIKKEPDFWGIQAGRIPVMAWDGVAWHEVFLNDDAPLVEIEAEPYKPVVGEWCEWRTNSMNWCEAFYIGVNDSGHKVFNNRDDKMFFVPSGVGLFRPVKTEREWFIERAMKATNGDPIDSTLRDLFDDMFCAGFKGPDDE